MCCMFSPDVYTPRIARQTKLAMIRKTVLDYIYEVSVLVLPQKKTPTIVSDDLVLIVHTISVIVRVDLFCSRLAMVKRDIRGPSVSRFSQLSPTDFLLSVGQYNGHPLLLLLVGDHY